MYIQMTQPTVSGLTMPYTSGHQGFRHTIGTLSGIYSDLFSFFWRGRDQNSMTSSTISDD